MGFQILWSTLIVFAIIRLLIQFHKKHISLFSFSFFLLAWSLVLLLNWNNALLNKIGHILGIERGATVLVYVALFILFYYVFISMVRFRKIEQDIDKLARKSAIESFLKSYNTDLTDKKNGRFGI